MVHGGELELKSCLLAASLFKNLACPHDLIGAVAYPEDTWGAMSAEGIAVLARCGVTRTPILNRISADYPIGNKLTALGVPSEFERVVFLDSDILLIRAFYDHPCLATGYAVKPADVETFTKNGGDWSRVYRKFHLPMPKYRVKSTHGDEHMMPYYNAGVICCRNNSQLSALWVDVCNRIDKDQTILNKRPWLDQIGLPVALSMLGVRPLALTEDLNFPGHKQDVEEAKSAYFCHYHWPSVIEASPRLRTLVAGLISEHPELLVMMNRFDEWKPVAACCTQ
ncbi:MAG: hypothetical protein O3A63_16275 [Proteobacteria bacterium]|nr:hypothetical protein [Pseudomonadota bacterium]